MKTPYYILPLFLLLSLLTACECEDLLPVDIAEVEETFQPRDVSSYHDGGYVITINFNRDIDTTSFLLGENLLLESTIAGPPFISVSIFRLRITFPQNNCNSNASCNESISVTIKGDGDRPLRSIDGLVLDGDLDFSPGGDFTETFVF